MSPFREIILEFDKSLFKTLGIEFISNFIQDLKVNQILHYSGESFTGIAEVLFHSEEKDLEKFKKHPHVLKFQEMYRYKKYITMILQMKVTLSFAKTLVDFQIFIKPPIYYQKDKVNITLLGSQKGLKGLFNELKQKNLPFSVLKVDTIDYQRDQNRVFSSLTTKQENILRYASENGYFEIPRGISTKSIADEFGITPAAVLEHLRKATKKIFEVVFK